MSCHKGEAEKALLAAGCFWGVEYFFRRMEGVVATTVGYAGGKLPSPTYKDVCSGTTGHAEVVEICFNPNKISFEALIKRFFEMHNPALITNITGKRSQYRSAIFYADQEQKMVAERLMEQLKSKAVDVRTELAPAGSFFKAEDCHQNYYTRRGRTPAVRRCTPKF